MKRLILLACLAVGGCEAMPDGSAGQPSPSPTPTPLPTPSDSNSNGNSSGDLIDDDVNSSVAKIQEATWLIVGVSDTSNLTATAFAIGGATLVTNAHVTDGLFDLFGEQNPRAFIFQNETGEMRTIERYWSHPEYNPSSFPSPDVSIIDVDADIAATLEFASQSDLEALQVFDAISLCGFPADVTEAIDIGAALGSDFRPRATCLSGHISQLRPFNSSDESTSQNRAVIQYDLPVTPGTSGSALFSESGEVVGVNSFAIGLQSGGDFRFGVRADQIVELIDLADTTSPVELTPRTPTEGSLGFDGSWTVNFDVGASVCFTVQNNLVTSFRDGCGVEDIVISPPLVTHDGVGPTFTVFWTTLGLDVTFFFEQIIENVYDAEVDDGISDFFGVATRT